MSGKVTNVLNCTWEEDHFTKILTRIMCNAQTFLGLILLAIHHYRHKFRSTSAIYIINCGTIASLDAFDWWYIAACCGSSVTNTVVIETTVTLVIVSFSNDYRKGASVRYLLKSYQNIC